MGVETVAVADAGPLIHLDELGGLEVLAVFSSLVVPDVVLREVGVHDPRLVSRRRWTLVRST